MVTAWTPDGRGVQQVRAPLSRERIVELDFPADPDAPVDRRKVERTETPEGIQPFIEMARRII